MVLLETSEALALNVTSSSVVAWKAWSHRAPWFHFFPVSPMTNSLQKSNFVLSKTAQCDPGCRVRKDLEYHYRAHRRTKTSLSKPENVPLFFSFSCRNEATIVLCIIDPTRAAGKHKIRKAEFLQSYSFSIGRKSDFVTHLSGHKE